MASNIDSSKPADGAAAVKADLRANLQAAKNEIEGVQEPLLVIAETGTDAALVDPRVKTAGAGELSVPSGATVFVDGSSGTITLTVNQADVAAGWTCTVTKWAAGTDKVLIAEGAGFTSAIVAATLEIFAQGDVLQVSRVDRGANSHLWVV